MPTSTSALWPVVHLRRLLYAEAVQLHRESESSATTARLDAASRQLDEAERALARARQQA
jgi:hypothetical protein